MVNPNMSGTEGREALHIDINTNVSGDTKFSPTRRSSRDIKRKKFDDELVESDLSPRLKKQKMIVGGIPGVTTMPKPKRGGFGRKRRGGRTVAPANRISTGPVTLSKREEKYQHELSVQNVGRWQPEDDLALITAVLQTNDLQAVYAGVKFSCKFTAAEIHQRWYALLYDKAVSKVAVDALRQIPPDVILNVQSKTLFSRAEEDILKSIPSTDQPDVQKFDQLLTEAADRFHPARVGQSLYRHWTLLKQYRLLCDQKPAPHAQRPDDQHLSWSDMEGMALQSVSTGPGHHHHQPAELNNPVLAREMQLTRRQLHKEMRVLENEIPKWQVLVESVTGISPPDFDSQTLAVLRGRVVRYLMRSREITLGRDAKGNKVDVNVALEGPAWKVSRKQATIKMKVTGEFQIVNEGRRAIHVDGEPVLTGTKAPLKNNSVVEIACLRFVFLLNQDLINTVRSDGVKLMLA